jgi:hypothetical protein
VTQVVEHLPSKLEALSSNPSAAKKKKCCTYVKNIHLTGSQWLTSVILATQEVEIKRIVV